MVQILAMLLWAALYIPASAMPGNNPSRPEDGSITASSTMSAGGYKPTSTFDRLFGRPKTQCYAADQQPRLPSVNSKICERVLAEQMSSGKKRFYESPQSPWTWSGCFGANEWCYISLYATRTFVSGEFSDYEIAKRASWILGDCHGNGGVGGIAAVTRDYEGRFEVRVAGTPPDVFS